MWLRLTILLWSCVALTILLWSYVVLTILLWSYVVLTILLRSCVALTILLWSYVALTLLLVKLPICPDWKRPWPGDGGGWGVRSSMHTPAHVVYSAYGTAWIVLGRGQRTGAMPRQTRGRRGAGEGLCTALIEHGCGTGLNGLPNVAFAC